MPVIQGSPYQAVTGKIYRFHDNWLPPGEAQSLCTFVKK
jgi:hypothetical protein